LKKQAKEIAAHKAAMAKHHAHTKAADAKEAADY